MLLTLAHRVQGTAKLDVWSEVVAPFHLMPRGVLEASGSAVMAGLVRSLLPPFLQRYARPLDSTHDDDIEQALLHSKACDLHCCRLGTDYERWATDPEYRIKRASREMAQPTMPTQW